MNDEDKNQKLLKKQLKNLNDKTKHIQKIMEKGKDTVVVRIGVQFTEFGFANWDSPLIIPTNLISATKSESNDLGYQKSTNSWEKAVTFINETNDEISEMNKAIKIGKD